MRTIEINRRQIKYIIRLAAFICINDEELVKVISNDLRSEYKTFPWKAVAGISDIIDIEHCV